MNPATLAAMRAPRDLAAWVACLQRAEIPVLPGTAEALEEFRLNEDAVDARIIAEAIGNDPLMTLKVLAYASAQRNDRRLSDAETVTEALVLMGITPFFRVFGPQRTVHEHLAGQDEALAGLQSVLERAGRAAQFALGFAIHRGDMDAAVLHEAALLHDFADMLLWLHAPTLALEIQRRQAADPTLRSAAVQQAVLNVQLPDVQQALMQVWRLPSLLVRITDDRHAEQTQVRNVLLAIRLARHTARGWDNAAVPDDVRDIAALLNLRADRTLTLLKGLDGLDDD